MSPAGKRIIEGAKEALAIAKGEVPAASVTIAGHCYVHLPKGYRILAPGDLDKVTLERAATACEDWRRKLDNRSEQLEGWAADQCAAAIRNSMEGKT